MKYGDRVITPLGPAMVCDVHRDKEHVSVLPDPPRPRRLYRFELADVQELP